MGFQKQENGIEKINSSFYHMIASLDLEDTMIKNTNTSEINIENEFETLKDYRKEVIGRRKIVSQIPRNAVHLDDMIHKYGDHVIDGKIPYKVSGIGEDNNFEYLINDILTDNKDRTIIIPTNNEESYKEAKIMANTKEKSLIVSKKNQFNLGFLSYQIDLGFLDRKVDLGFLNKKVDLLAPVNLGILDTNIDLGVLDKKINVLKTIKDFCKTEI